MENNLRNYKESLNRMFEKGKEAERNRKKDLEDLKRIILTYCLENKIHGSFNQRYGDWLISFEIKELEPKEIKQ